MRPLWKRHQYDRNALFTWVSVMMGVVERSKVEKRVKEALYSLEVYPRERRIFEVDNSTITDISTRLFDRDQSTCALPLNFLPTSSFIWKSSPTKMRSYPGAKGKTAHVPLDYLLAYWLWRDMKIKNKTLE